MNTDKVLALAREAAGNLYMAYNAFTRNDAIAWEPLKETADRITALLDSGIKDAGDDVVEPELWGVERDLVSIKDYDTLLSAYRRVQQEKKTVIDVYEGNLREADKRLIFWQERAEKAEAEIAAMHKAAGEEAGHEMGLWTIGAVATVARLKSEREQFRKALQSIAANTCCANCQEAALVARAAIDSARNK